MNKNNVVYIIFVSKAHQFQRFTWKQKNISTLIFCVVSIPKGKGLKPHLFLCISNEPSNGHFPSQQNGAVRLNHPFDLSYLCCSWMFHLAPIDINNRRSITSNCITPSILWNLRHCLPKQRTQPRIAWWCWWSAFVELRFVCHEKIPREMIHCGEK